MKHNLENRNIHLFLEEHQIKTENGSVLDFHNHPFLWDIYQDRSTKICCKKAAQIGYSTLSINKLLWTVKNQGADAIYCLPTANDVHDFVGGKVNRIIQQNPVYQAWTADKDAVEQKKVGDNVVYFRGTWTQRAALMVSAKLLAMDELDRSNMEVVEQYDSRQQHETNPIKWAFSNPSIPFFGVDKYWQLSDKQEWFVQCDDCKEWQTLTWPDNVDQEQGMYICKHCYYELTDEARRKGEWRPTAEGEWRGYHISLMMAPWVPAARIVEYAKTKTPEYFHNFVLGEPYAAPGSRPSEEDILGNCTETKPERIETPIVIGVDPGLPIWWVAGNKTGAFALGHCNDYSDIERMMHKWPNAIAVIDQGGDLVGSRKLREQFPGRVYLAAYRTDRATYSLIDWNTANETGTVRIDRNRLISIVFEEFKERRMPLWGTRAEWTPLWHHIANVYRVTEDNSIGVPVHRWERQGPDHYLHAFCYMRSGLSKYGDVGEIVRPNATASQELSYNQLTGMPAHLLLQGLKKKKDWRS